MSAKFYYSRLKVKASIHRNEARNIPRGLWRRTGTTTGRGREEGGDAMRKLWKGVRAAVGCGGTSNSRAGGAALLYISLLPLYSEEKHFHKSGPRYMCSQFPGSGY
ncbi:hypothetical protein GWI33_020307 [Rhynchophorus ferrugineus]|uniref:Uncharacterized protein n=1 Tax=Rhynchophorus ferrugineus TaxID=354439 RepID=A0A834HQP4_RHYFE|nr:hypothetical protein GWI33_020307 [Rhynchophorus ferrugineus]